MGDDDRVRDQGTSLRALNAKYARAIAKRTRAAGKISSMEEIVSTNVEMTGSGFWGESFSTPPVCVFSPQVSHRNWRGRESTEAFGEPSVGKGLSQ